ncbi:MAG TPA: metallophosphoesterase, partial [Bacteroidales bacterium]|nr:metallophosphoesterase [Bacteroidales bacterium]
MANTTNKDDYKLIIEDKQIKTIKQFIKAAEIDLNEWIIKKCVANKWDVHMKIDNVPVLRENWQTKLFLEKKLHIPDIKKFKEEILNEIKTHSIKVPKLKQTSVKQNSTLAEIHIPDLHLGKVGVTELADKTRWKTITAFKNFQKVINYFISFLQNYPVNKILFVVGNDLFNTATSTPYPQTTAGTPQSEDDYGQLIFRFGKYLIIESIYKLYSLVPNIEIKMIPGNHDNDKVFYLGEILEAMFYNNENIQVDNSISPRKYFKWGINLLGFSHGNYKAEGVKRLSYLMQIEQPKEWSTSKIREWHLGDIHHTKKIELLTEEDVQGLIIRYFRTLMIG